MWTHCRSWPINVIILNEIDVRMIFCLGTGNNWWQWSMSLALLYDTILVAKLNWWKNEENKHCRRCQYGTKIFFRHVNRWKNFPQYNNTLVTSIFTWNFMWTFFWEYRKARVCLQKHLVIQYCHTTCIDLSYWNATVQCSDINFTFSTMWRQKNRLVTCCNVIIFRIHAWYS